MKKRKRPSLISARLTFEQAMEGVRGREVGRAERGNAVLYPV